MTPSGADRRKFPRVQIMGEIQGRVMPLEIPFELIDISLGGFAGEFPLEFIPATEYQFQLWSLNGPTVLLRAVNTYSLKTVAGTSLRCVAGFEFVPSREARQAVTALIQDVQDSRSERPELLRWVHR